MGGVFALGMLALLVLFVCLTLFGMVCLVLALVFGLIYRGRAKKQKQGGDKVKTVWKVLPWAFLAAGLLAIYPAAWIAHDLRDPVSNLNDAVLHDDYDKATLTAEPAAARMFCNTCSTTAVTQTRRRISVRMPST